MAINAACWGVRDCIWEALLEAEKASGRAGRKGNYANVLMFTYFYQFRSTYYKVVFVLLGLVVSGKYRAIYGDILNRGVHYLLSALSVLLAANVSSRASARAFSGVRVISACPSNVTWPGLVCTRQLVEYWAVVQGMNTGRMGLPFRLGWLGRRRTRYR